MHKEKEMLSTSKSISLLYRYCQKNIEIKLESLGITSGTYFILLTILDNDEISQEELVSLTELEKSTITRAVQKLVKQDFIEVKICKEDRRKRIIRATPKSRNIHKIILTEVENWNDIISKDLSNIEIEEMKNILNKMSNNASDYIDKLQTKEDSTSY
jgi:DNA-binding MarR family transcriptional regulator